MKKIICIMFLSIYGITFLWANNQHIFSEGDKKFAQFVKEKFTNFENRVEEIYSLAKNGANGIFTQTERANLLAEIKRKLNLVNIEIESLSYSGIKINLIENNPYNKRDNISNYYLRNPIIVLGVKINTRIENETNLDSYTFNEIRLSLLYLLDNLKDEIDFRQYVLEN